MLELKTGQGLVCRFNLQNHSEPECQSPSGGRTRRGGRGRFLPLGFITLSFRQLTTMMVSFLAAFLVSLPFEFPIAGVSFGGRAAVFCVVFGIGYMISSRRVRLLPVELQAVYFLRTKGVEKLRPNLRSLLGSKKPERDPASESGQLTHRARDGRGGLQESRSPDRL